MDASSLQSVEGQVVIGTVATYVLQKIKGVPWVTFIHQGTPRTNKAISMLIASATAAGFSLGYSGSLESGMVATITIPPLSQAVDFAVRAVFAYIVQEAVYQKHLKAEMPVPPPPQSREG